MQTQFQHPNGPIRDWALPKDFTGDYNLGIYTQETTKRFVYGTRYLTWDGKVYKYAKAGSTIAATDSELLSWQAFSQTVDASTVAATTSIGDRIVKVDIGAGSGNADDGVIAVDSLEGGQLLAWHATTATIQRGIIGNEAAATSEMKIVVDAPFDVVLTLDATYVEAMCSPYFSVKNGSSGENRCFVGMPQLCVTSGYYHWLQTYGPFWASPEASVGASEGALQVVAGQNGSLVLHTTASSCTKSQQHIGFVMSHAAGQAQGAPFIMLQISM
jgi:hypothetical protein